MFAGQLSEFCRAEIRPTSHQTGIEGDISFGEDFQSGDKYLAADGRGRRYGSMLSRLACLSPPFGEGLRISG